MGFWDNKKQIVKSLINKAKGTIKDRVLPIASTLYRESVPYRDSKYQNMIKKSKEYTGVSPLYALKKNVLDQTPYTPEAERMVKKMSIGFIGRKDPGYEDRDDIRTNAYYHSGDNNIKVNGKSLYDSRAINSGGLTNTLRHELLHSMDNNVNKRSGLATSKGYNKAINIKDSANIRYILQKTDYSDSDIDPETFARYPGRLKQFLLNAPQKEQAPYKKIYIPYTKNINYSPIYPADSYLERFQPSGGLIE